MTDEEKRIRYECAALSGLLANPTLKIASTCDEETMQRMSGMTFVAKLIASKMMQPIAELISETENLFKE